jgi:long-chain acyl-CoA synthetase
LYLIELAGVAQSDLFTNAELKAEILSQLEAKAKEYNLSGIERIKKIFITTDESFTKNDLLTPTFKLKRFNAKEHFKKEIAEMYAEAL